MKYHWTRYFYRMITGTVTITLSVSILGGVLLGGLFLSKWAQNSPIFILDTILVTGNENIDQHEIITISGLERGRNIWASNLTETKRRLLLDRRIDSVVVHRKFPNTIDIVVKEHIPIALVQLDRLYGISMSAELIPVTSDNSFLDLPVITVPDLTSNASLEANLTQEPTFESLRNAILVNPELDGALYLIRVLRALSPGLYDELSELHVSRQEGLIAYMVDGGLAIRFGIGRYPRKIEMLKHTVERLEADKIKTQLIDLRFKDQVIVRPTVSSYSKGSRT